MTDLPRAVRVAAAQYREQRPVPELPLPVGHRASGRVSRGDVRIVYPPAATQPVDARLCLILGVDSTDEFADVVLVHSASELATSVDGTVSKEVSETPYEIVVQTELRGTVWTFQIGRRVGHLSEDALGALGSIALGDDSPEGNRVGDGIRRGSPLSGPNDRRWAFKEAEGSTFRHLTRESTRVLLDGDSIWEVDAELLHGEGTDEVADQGALFEEFWRWVQTRRSRRMTIPDSTLEGMLRKADAADPGTWSAAHDLAMDLDTTVWELAATISTEGQQVEAGQFASRGIVSARHLARAEHESFDHVHYLGEPTSA